MNEQLLLDRIEHLENQVAFQDQSIEQLNQVITEQTLLLVRLQEQLRLLSEKLRVSQPSMIAPLSEETLPPHY